MTTLAPQSVKRKLPENGGGGAANLTRSKAHQRRPATANGWSIPPPKLGPRPGRAPKQPRSNPSRCSGPQPAAAAHAIGQSQAIRPFASERTAAHDRDAAPPEREAVQIVSREDGFAHRPSEIRRPVRCAPIRRPRPPRPERLLSPLPLSLSAPCRSPSPAHRELASSTPPPHARRQTNLNTIIVRPRASTHHCHALTGTNCKHPAKSLPRCH